MSGADVPASPSAPAREPPAWTRGGFALPALFAGSVIESTILPWPIEFPLLAVMLRGRAHVFPAALAVTAGSVLGCLLTFLLGAFAYDAIAPQLAAHEGWAAAVTLAQDKAAARGAVAVLVGMMTPAPVQITSFAAGAAGVGLWAFLAACAAGRTIRYFAMAVLVFAFGPRIMDVWRARSRRTRRIGLVLIAILFVVALIAAVMI